MAEENSVEFKNKWCPHSCSSCRTDCVCCHWDKKEERWVCGYNAQYNTIYKKRSEVA